MRCSRLLVGLVLVLAATPSLHATHQTAKPNIVFILADDEDWVAGEQGEFVAKSQK